MIFKNKYTNSCFLMEEYKIREDIAPEIALLPYYTEKELAEKIRQLPLDGRSDLLLRSDLVRQRIVGNEIRGLKWQSQRWIEHHPKLELLKFIKDFYYTYFKKMCEKLSNPPEVKKEKRINIH